MSGECKFCGAAWDSTPGGIPMWECGTYESHNNKLLMQSQLCQKHQLARFRKLFPTIMPDDPREVSAEICEALGLLPMQCGTGIRWMCGRDRMVLMEDTGVVLVVAGSDNPQSATAGQLACLIAARRNVETD